MRGIIKASTASEAIRAGLDRGLEVVPIRKGEFGTEWFCNLNALSVEHVHLWYVEDKPLKEGEGYPVGTLLFFDMGTF